jgi:hypothetical protein
MKRKYIVGIFVCALAGVWFIQGNNFLSKEAPERALPANESEAKANRFQASMAENSFSATSQAGKVLPPPKIPQPKTEWRTRYFSINGKSVKYVFGEGNPREVALSGKALEGHWRTNSRGYMTPEAEEAIKIFLGNPSLPYFLEKCYKQLDWYHEKPNLSEESKFPHNLDMEDMLYIDPETGRKEFDYNKIRILDAVFNYLDFKLEPDEAKRQWVQCLSPQEYKQHFLPLQLQIESVWRTYGNQYSHI